MKEDTKDYILYDFIYVIFQKDNRDINLINSCQGLEVEGTDSLQRGMRELFGVIEMFHMLIVVVISQLYTSAKTFTTCKLYPVNLTTKKLQSRNHLSLNSFMDDKCITHTKRELELSGNR